jgi:hypothetical protein
LFHKNQINMKKIVLFLMCAIAQLNFGQTHSDPNPYRAYNFSGNIGGGMRKSQTYPLPSNSSIALTNDRNGNPLSAIDIPSNSPDASKLTLTRALNGLDQTTDNYTIGFWFKKNGAQSAGLLGNWSIRPFLLIPNSSNIGYAEGTFLGFTENGLDFKMGHVNNTNNTAYLQTFAIPTGVTVTNWNYYTLIKSGSKLSVYINNTLASEKNFISFAPFSASRNIYLGGHTADIYSGYCKGAFDNVTIFDTALDLTDRSILYYRETMDSFHSSFTLARYDFNGDVDNDTFGNFDAIAFNNPQLGPDRFGVANSALKVSASVTNNVVSHNGIRIPYLNDYFNRSEGTISFWFKKTGEGVLNNGENLLVMLPNESYDARNKGASLALGIWKTSTNKLYAYGMGGNMAMGSETASAGLLTGQDEFFDDSWQHVVMTFKSNGEINLYHNGQFNRTNTILPFPRKNNGGSTDILVGFNTLAYGGANTGFEGLIDELIFDKRVHTPAEIAQSYQEYLDTLSNEQFQKETFNFYPNPVENVLFVEKEGNITIFDLSGRLVLLAEQAKQVDVSSLAKGTYLLQLEVDGQINVQKFIKK